MARGAIGLLGGLEHRRGIEAIGRLLIETSGSPRPRVVVIPHASDRRTLPQAGGCARQFWNQLGAFVHVALLDGSQSATLEAVGNADVIMITGGHPQPVDEGFEWFDPLAGNR